MDYENLKYKMTSKELGYTANVEEYRREKTRFTRLWFLIKNEMD